jgi:broad specificity phosphatase PhoE
MQRAIQTCLYAFRSQIDWGNVRMELLGDLQETSLMPCDKGSSKEQLREWFPELDGQLNALADGWEEKSACDCQPEALSERSRRVMEWLMARPEQVIVCVTHNGFLRHLLGQNLWSEQGERPMGFANAEVRRLVLHREPAVKHDDDDDGSGERNSQRQFRLTKSGIVIIDRTFSNEIAEIGHLD